ncbi:NEDD8-activating enzyme E1 catalytic subunit [Caenorhabditis elegans]|uniref:NEDD8-activating enzyme E1 catalytic subunit n=1 Tax=Caenorhabditis elegans TaxID=6239 RepID=UBA3_CAEEL|nr:NEDD8-activating enzyme E1 catalytic subunit [Caenorhabditis elegans]Q19360.2 RecName: Full=NEDD8-activating enzyme E1 catalytic subunit; AltName: Full=Ectopic membrane ruffles in embryo protein 1; AltName: Full=Ubiquitin-activating enzyme 3 homolog [Caenorhabditis elegans]CCD63395.1 NEDD8-activating enzyme E1 catalytic subunit [Caenorhabditis elegans]|eukprot:NP_498534.2 NEDD8-activating enzyme E1 catalytic subunit [Caenorhabditis elegans]
MVSVDPLATERWRSIRRLTDRDSAYKVPWFVPGPENFEALQNTKILVIGAGGLGCELLKNLALSGFRTIEVIDMDTIDVSNLNRQFLFRESDVGKSKAEVAAAFVQQRVVGCQVTAHNCRIEDKGQEFYRKFSIIICGLDSIPARRWINGMLCDLVLEMADGKPDENTIIPMIDGGTEGFKGNARVIYPKFTACIDCTLDLYPPQVNFPLCTIAHTPRLPEHCIEYIKVVVWPEEKPFEGVSLDADDPIHVEWVLERASLRAEKYNIRGVDRRLTSGVLKRIIPAVASTNAVIAASCALEALKLATNIAKPIDNYLNFTQIHGAYTSVVSMMKDDNCLTCSGGRLPFEVSPSSTLESLIIRLSERFHLKHPTLATSTRKLYCISSFMPQFEQESKENLHTSMKDLVSDGEEILVSDEALSRALTLRIQLI